MYTSSETIKRAQRQHRYERLVFLYLIRGPIICLVGDSSVSSFKHDDNIYNLLKTDHFNTGGGLEKRKSHLKEDFKKTKSTTI